MLPSEDEITTTAINDENRTNSSPQPDQQQAASCVVSNVSYKHGQPIKMKDECDFCLCIDGDMFCYWECPAEPTSSPITSNGLTAKTIIILPTTASSTIITSNPKTEHYQLKDNRTSADIDLDAANKTTPTSEIVQNNSSTSSPTKIITDDPVTATAAKQLVVTSCSVKGVKYEIGSVLPAESGSCLQCTCDVDATVVCSAKDCIPAKDRTSDEQTLQSEMPSTDMFDVNVL